VVPASTSSLAIPNSATRIAARCGNALLFALPFGYAALRTSVLSCVTSVKRPRYIHTATAAKRDLPLVTRHTRYANNGDGPYNGTQVDSMCSNTYTDCQSSSAALGVMCKLAANNVYWNGLSMEEQAKGFQSFREEALRKAQSAFLYRHVPPSPAIAARRLTPSAAQHRHCADRLRAVAENPHAEPVCGGGEEREPSVSAFSRRFPSIVAPLMLFAAHPSF